MNTLIKNTCIVTMNEKRNILYDGAIYIEKDRIVDIGSSDLLEERWSHCNKVVDGKGKIVFPGLINTHNHLYQVLLKGLGDDMVLKDWLEFMTFPSSPFLTEENCYYAALNGLVEGIHSGVTTTFDYMYPHAKGTHDLDEGVLAAMKDLKIRGVLGRGYMDTGIEFGVHPSMIEKPEDIEASVRKLYKEYQGSENGRITIAMAPAALWSNSDASLKMTQKVSADLDILVSIHVSETPFDKEATLAEHGKWELPLLKDLKLLNDKLIMVHCVYLSEEDMDDIKDYGATVSHNPMSNMYLSSGVAPIPALNRKGVPVGLGLDGAASNNSNDMIELLKATALLQKASRKEVIRYGCFKMKKKFTITERYSSESNAGSYGAHFAMVKIHKKTGEITITDYVAVCDVGKVINPILLEGQIHGGIQMGIGMALTEELVFDDRGKILNANFKGYKMPRAKNMPKNMKVIFVEEGEPEGPFGAKSIGEAAVNPVAPAIVNTINNCLGSEFVKFPVTVGMIKEKLRKM